MSQPDQFINPEEKEKVCLLQRAIYGLKQASRVWNLQIHNELCALGLKQSNYDECLNYVKNNSGLTLLSLYVDDMLVLCTQDRERELRQV